MACEKRASARLAPKYSKGGYANAQAEAKRELRGMWGGSFTKSRGIIGLAGGPVEGRKVVRMIDKHLASRIVCIDEEIVTWLERREQRRRGESSHRHVAER